MNPALHPHTKHVNYFLDYPKLLKVAAFDFLVPFFSFFAALGLISKKKRGKLPHVEVMLGVAWLPLISRRTTAPRLHPYKRHNEKKAL